MSCVIAGAGVIGLAIGRALCLRGIQVYLVDSGPCIGSVTSSRNSEVIHAGIYYPPGSNKARCCVAGRRLLYEFCDEHFVDYKKCGKLVVATSEEEESILSEISERAEANGLSKERGDMLELLSAAEARRLEPELKCTKALYSPSTGILDSHGFMVALHGIIEQNGGNIVLSTLIESVEITGNGMFLTNTVDLTTKESFAIEADYFVNAAGLDAPLLAQCIHKKISNTIDLPSARFAKGNYYRLQGQKAPFRHLVYPVPQEAGLGVHITIDLGGQARFGPDVEWLEISSSHEIDYSVDENRSLSFYNEIRKYWPNLQDGSILPDYSGVRPKLHFNAEDQTITKDFLFLGPKHHNQPGLVHLLGIESPGLTSSLAIAQETAYMLGI